MITLRSLQLPLIIDSYVNVVCFYRGLVCVLIILTKE